MKTRTPWLAALVCSTSLVLALPTPAGAQLTVYDPTNYASNVMQAARALGAGTPRVLFRHVVPTAMPAVMVQATLGMAGSILAEASLSFLGLGVQPPTPSWGTMLNGGRLHLLDAPHLTIFPGAAIAALVLGFNFLGDGLRDLLDPKRYRA